MTDEVIAEDETGRLSRVGEIVVLEIKNAPDTVTDGIWRWQRVGPDFWWHIHDKRGLCLGPYDQSTYERIEFGDLDAEDETDQFDEAS